MEWYYALNGQQTGPVDETEFNRLINTGIIQSTTLVWHAGLAEWQPLAKVQPAAAADGTAFRYAGFWIRFAAKFIDGLIIFIACLPVTLTFKVKIPANLNPNATFPDLGEIIVTQLGVIAFGIVVRLIYNTFFIGKYAATPGKMLCKVKVIMADGSKPTYLRAFGRFWAELLSRMICYVGYIIAAFDGEKRSLHDHICSTRVIYK